MSKEKYLPADDSFLINDDIDLKPIRISLPKPPPLEFIDGYGKPILEQKFERQQIPERLEDLINVTKRRLQKEERSGTNSKTRVTPQKLIDELWEELEQNENNYQNEINWIKRQWYFRLNGYWFFCKGKPTYITGAHYLLLNFWKLPDVDGGGYFQYRDRDRREFLFFEYTNNTHETFADLDENGFAIKKNGKYRMKEMPYKVSFGNVQPKNRRGGNSTKGTIFCYEIVANNIGKSMGMQSFSEDSSSKLFKDKLINGWRNLPFFFRPMWNGSDNPAEEINFDLPRHKVIGDSLGGRIDYAKNADSKYYDSKKLHSILLDEEGKGLKESDVSERWEVVKLCLALGGVPIGYAYHPSNVADMDAKGGKFYEEICDMSDFYQRNPANGQTMSGLFRMFFSAHDCLEKYVDYWGQSVEDNPTSEQKRYGFKNNHGSKEEIESQRKQLILKGTPEAMSKLRELKKKMPIRYNECFLGAAAQIGFNIEKLDKRIPQIDRRELLIGNFKRVNNLPDGDVYFENDPDGKFIVSELLQPEKANRRIRRNIFNSLTGEWEIEWTPEDGTKFVSAADPYKFRQANPKGASVKLSNGGGATFKRRDKTIDTDTRLIENWETFNFVCTYNSRPSTQNEYGEDMLMMCQYYGSMMFPEVNVDFIWKYFIERGYAGYLLYMLDAKGEKKSNPGQYTSDTNKEDMFSYWADYIEKHIDKEIHVELMEDSKLIKGTTDMTNYDRLTAAMLCLVADRSYSFEQIKRAQASNQIITKWFPKHRY